MSIDTYTDLAQKPIGAIEYRGAVLLAEAFKIAALVIGVLGVLAGVVLAVDADGSGAERVMFALAWILGSLFTAAAIAFFGYVLSLLVGIYTQVWESRFPEED